MLRWVSWRDGQQLCLVRGVAEEAVPEAVPTQPDLGDRLDDRGVLQAEQRLVDRPPGQLAQRLLVEFGAERGRQLRDAQVDARCPKAGREDLVDAGREDLTGSRGDGAAGQLLRKRGMPAPRSTIGGTAPHRGSPSVSAATNPAASFSWSGSSSMSRTDGGPRCIQREPAGDQDHRAGDALGGQEPQQVDGRRVGPVEILDQHQGGCRGRRVREPGDEGLERLLAERERVHLRTRPPLVGLEPEQRGQQRHGVALQTGILQSGLQDGEPLLGWLVRVEAEQLLEHAPDRPQRDVAVIRRALGLEHDPALEVHVRCELRGQRRLPHAGHPTEDDDRLVGSRTVLGVVDDALPDEAEQAALTLPADQGHRLGQPATRGGTARFDRTT